MGKMLKINDFLRRGVGIAGLIAVAAPSLAQGAAANSVQLSSEAMIERTVTDASGKDATVLKAPKDVIVVPGDHVVFKLRYTNKGAIPATGFRATNPMPGPIQFVGAVEDWAEVSVDGGKSWGKLSDLTVKAKAADGSETTRAAAAEDVTHVRWVFANPIAPGAEGTLTYRGIIK